MDQKMSENSDCNLLIPELQYKKSRVTAAWRGNSSLSVIPRCSIVTRHFPCDVYVYEVKTNLMIFHPIMRKLVNESNGYFLYAQKLTDLHDSAKLQTGIMKLSRQYRSVIRASLIDFQNMVLQCANRKDKIAIYRNISVLYNMELIWHLCEIFYVETATVDVYSRLLPWVRFHFPDIERTANDILCSHVNVETLPNFWLVVIDCLLQRRIGMVRALLKLHPKSAEKPFQLVDSLLRTMPIFQLYGGLTMSEFSVRHLYWRREAEQLLEEKTFSLHKYLEIIVRIIIGDKSVQELIKSHCQTWYQYLVACLLYITPVLKVFDLPFYAKQSIIEFNGQCDTSDLDLILLSIFEIDVVKTVEKLKDWDETKWITTHLTNLLYLCGKLNILQNQATQFQESVILEYGTALMSHHSLWQVGIDYLEYCPAEGKTRLKVLLSNIPFKTERAALKLIQIARQKYLHEVANTVTKIQVMRYLKRGNLGAALSWSLRARDPVVCSLLTDVYLKNYCKNQVFIHADLLEHLGLPKMCDRLAFLKKYFEFHQMLKLGFKNDAASLLTDLIVNNIPPKYFWSVVLKDLLKLLHDPNASFLLQHIFSLMVSIDKMVADSSNNDSLSEYHIDDIRLALDKKLAVGILTRN